MKHLNLIFTQLLFLALLLTTSTFAVWTHRTNDSNNLLITLDVDKDFKQIYGGQSNAVYGDMVATGESNLFVNDPNTDNYSGALYNSNPSYMLSDNDFVASASGDARKVNASTATLNLPSYVKAEHIKWAGLFWQGQVHENVGNGLTTAAVDTRMQGWNTITMKTPDGIMHTITAPLNVKNTSNATYHYGMKDNNSFRYFYGAFKDVTTLIKNSYTAPDNNFTVGNLMLTSGADFGDNMFISHAFDDAGAWFRNLSMGYFGGWSLVVVYNLTGTPEETNPNEVYKNISLYHGYDLFLTWASGTKDTPFDTTIPLSGFLTPKGGIINSKLLFFGGGADQGINFDTLQIQEKKTSSFSNLSNSLNPSGLQYNNTYSNLGQNMKPNKPYRQGMDLDIYDVSSHMDNDQNSTQIKFGIVKSGNTADQIFPQTLGFSTELFTPDICYDYTYGQGGHYTIASNTNELHITDNFDTNRNLDVKFFIQNRENSDVTLSNTYIHVNNIDTTQATYIRESTKIVPPEGTVQTILDAGRDVSDAYDLNISIGTVGGLASFYTYYSMSPKKADIDMPINVSMQYDLTINGTILGTQEIALKNLPICDASSDYGPTYGTLNIVHPSSYKNGEVYYYNLPTQIVNRTGNFKLQAMDDINVNQPIIKPAIAALDMIDVSGFHYTTATCTDPESTVINNNHIWTIIDGSSSISPIINKNQLTNEGFFSSALESAAFRISYNTTADGEPLNLVQLSSGDYKIDNFPSYAQGQQCQANFIPPNGNSSQIVTWCGNNGQGGGQNGMDPAELATCMECIYGLNTKVLCSRDNFSIRPESYNITFKDRDQNLPSLTQNIQNNMPGPANIDLAAGYKYHIDVNATDHSNSGPTPRYNTTNIEAKYVWNITPTGICNDESNKSIDIKFYNGFAQDNNSTVSQVGKYALSILDEMWTKVDHVSEFMGHHNTAYFREGSDCITDSSTTIYANDASNLNGCNIDSLHTNTEFAQVYTNLSTTYHPYKFDVSSISLYTRPNDNGSWLYMNDLAKSKLMAATLEGNITARGYDNSALSNYTNGCMAQDIMLDTNYTSAPANIINEDGITVAFERTLKNIDNSFTLLTDANTSTTFTKDHFKTTGDSNGSAQAEIYFNIKKPYDKTVNVTDINFTVFTARGINDISNADFVSNHEADGNTTIGQNRLFFFSEITPLSTADGKQIFSPTITYTTPLFVDTYCVPDAIIGLNCSLITQFSGLDEIFSTGGGWYRTSAHNSTLGDGRIISLSEASSLANLTISPNVNITLDTNGSSVGIDISYPIAGRPVDPVIEITPDEWLKYSPVAAKLGIPDFTLHFLSSGLKWKGVGHTGNVVETEPNNNNSGRLGW